MFGYGELIVILFIVLVLFGGKKLPEFAKSLGKGINEFKRALNGEPSNELEKPAITPQEIEIDNKNE